MANELNKPSPSTEELPLESKIKEIPKESLEIMEHFGINAASLLNNYCCALEDALVEQVERAAQSIEEIKRLRSLLEKHNISH